jgi:hypothetical protein
MTLGNTLYRFGIRYTMPLILAVALVLTLVTISWERRVPVAAQLASFYASECTGGWENPGAASGQPDVSGDGYVPNNSAVFLDNAAHIVCGGFVGELPPLTYHSEATVRFSWDQPGRVVTSVEDLRPITEEVQASIVPDTVESISAEATTSSNDTETETANNSIIETTPTVEESVLDTLVPSTIAEPQEEVEIPDETNVDSAVLNVEETVAPAEVVSYGAVSWRRWLIPKVFAADVVAEEVLQPMEVQSMDVQSVQVESDTTIPVITADLTSELASTSNVENNPEPVIPSITSAVVQRAETSQFLVSYQVADGPWVRLGDVVTIHNDIRLPLPKMLVQEISDFSSVRIRIEPLSQFDQIPPVYLDALWIEVNYAPIDALGVHSVSPLVPTTHRIVDVIFSPSTLTTTTTTIDQLQTSSTTLAVSIDTFTPEAFATALQWLQGIDGRLVLAEVVSSSGTELWLFDLVGSTVTRIGFADGAPGTIRPIAKDGILFWLNDTGNKIFTYDTRTADRLYEFLLAVNLPSVPEYTFDFPYTSWRLIWRGQQLFVYHPDTGEVFGDSDGRSFEAFVQTFSLSSLLSPDQRDQLGLTPTLIDMRSVDVAE